MTKTPDMTAMFKDAMAAFPMNASSTQDAFKSGAEFNEKLSGVALGAIENSTSITAQWTSETAKGLSDVAKAKSAPADYMQAMTDFASNFATAASEHLKAYGDIAQKAQTDTFEVITSAGKHVGAEATYAAKATAKDAAEAAKATTAAAK